MMKHSIKAAFAAVSIALLSFSASAEPFQNTLDRSANDYRDNITNAKLGDGESECIIGDCFLIGAGVDKDFHTAWTWYAKSAGHGCNEARYRIACFYDQGYGVTQSDKEAAYWYGRAAKNGHPQALLKIGDCYYQGKGLQADKKCAAMNYWRSADRGVAEAAYKLAIMLRDGKGFDQDKSMALKYFNQAAEANYRDADKLAADLVSEGVSLPVKKTASSAKASKQAKKPSVAKVSAKKRR